MTDPLHPKTGEPQMPEPVAWCDDAAMAGKYA